MSETASRWQGLWRREDWWANWLGLGIVIVAAAVFASGGTIKPIAIKPPRWSDAATLASHFAVNAPLYLLQFGLWLAVFGASARAMGLRLREFVPSFAFVYLMAIVIFVIGNWDVASRYNFEAPLVALILGLLIANLTRLPRWMDTGFRVEYYIKTGIVLLGATLPFTLIAFAGPVAFGQATLVSVVTFTTIFLVGRKLGLDRRLCAVLGAGGSVCGVSAAIAMGAAVRATKEQISVAITLVIVWAIVMIFFLPMAAGWLHLPAGAAGAWIGTSEFADAAGLAAAQAYGIRVGGEDQAVWAFTLLKVIGRDMWIGIWAFVFALVATTRWEGAAGSRPSAATIWERFPKFVLGFLIASILMTLITRGYSYADYKKTVDPLLIAPIKDLRTWAFIFCFFSIGLTTRFRELAGAGGTPLKAFTAGVVVNVLLGLALSGWLLLDYWSGLSKP